MGVGRRKLVPFLVLALALACSQHTGQAQQDTLKSVHEHRSDFSHPQGHVGTPLDRVTIIPPLKTIPVVRALNPAHTRQVCSTWGNFHYKTFDGQVFYFPGLCNYVFSAHCGDAYEDFNIQLRRGQESNSTTLSRVTMKLDGLVVELTKSSVLVNNRPVQLPFSQSGVLIELSNGYVKVVARLGLLFMWNDDDSLLLELDTKYTNKTCGLCGDFNGSPNSSEFLSHNVRLTPLEFGNLQKMDGPTEQCQDPLPVSQKNCSTRSGVCEKILKGQLFSDCAALVDISSYLEACWQDLCLCESSDPSDCICHTLAEYSRQCAHAGGQPQDWRGPSLCSQTCPLNMQHQECGSPCVDTCSNPQRSQVCEDHCVAGCFCPEGMVLDDVNQTGCVPVSQCACLYNGTFYAPGTNYSTDCTNTCSGGQWSCQEVPCSGACSVLGGSHISTFDERQYTVHGDCTYVLSKPCNSNAFTVLTELRKCGLTESETCLKTVTLNLGGGQTVVTVKATGEVFVNQIYTQLPVSTANVTFFRPSTFFIIGQTNLGLQLEIQLNPIMQVSVRLTPELRGLTCGLCGNFNSMQADDFQTISGVVEGTAAAFFNTFKTQAACPNVKNIFEDPCSLSVENEKYALHWCSQLTNASGPFSQCHATVNPSTFFSNCMFDTCNCEKSEDCMCAALSSYVRACAAKGVLLSDWRDGICPKATITCPKSMTYQYHISTCQPTCRSLNEEDVTCHISFIPVDGCTCPKGTFLDDSGKCVQATSCPCYYKGSTVPNGESVHDSGAVCTCTQGALTCIGGPAPTPVCDAPMIYFDCRNATLGDTGAGCQKSCHTLDMTCYSSECVPGCVCPNGLVADGNGGCVVAEDCPCVHNEATYRPGETIQVGCNNCTCENRMWRCTDKPCLATCAVYGDGHYITFDGQRYSFNGDCEYTLLQDNCGGNGSSQDAFRVVTENIPCGTTGTTCSKGIKIFLGNYELKLSDSKMEVVQKDAGQEPPYFVHQMGNYLVVETDIGLVLLWDKKTSIFLRLSPEFKGKVCGLCGNFDDNAINDFTTRSQSVVSDMLEFGNSWKLSPSCPDVLVSEDPCTANPYRKSWAQKQCSIINSATFSACHAHVEPAKYYEACVNDACACDSGGDCECFCTAVAAYAQACHEVGVCVSWRTPDICPLFCDYYNPEGQCEWHYQPCGAPCMRTCQNPTGQCLQDLRGLEGCYPKCPPTAPIFDEGTMQCVSNCTVTPSPLPPHPCRVNGKLYWPGASVPSDKNCHSCFCTESGVNCTHDAGACVCTYNGQQYHHGDIIYHTTDGMGGCISAHCLANGTIDRRVDTCSSTTSTPPTTFSFSTPLVMTSMRPSSTHSSPTPSVVYPGSPSKVASTTSSILSVKTPATGPSLTTSTSASTVTTSGCQEECLWSPWMDVSHPGRGIDSGDFDTLENLRAHGYQICQVPKAVECRAEDSPDAPLHELQQSLECSTTVGLTCYNRDQESGLCDNYQIKVQCCTPISCPTSSGHTQTTHLIASRTTTMGDTTSSVPVTSTEHAYSTVTSGPSPLSSVPSSPAPAPSTPVAVTSTTVKTTLTTTSPTPEPTPATSSVSISTSGSTRASFETTHECKQELCHWTDWIDGSYPGPSRDSGDFDTFVNLRSKGYKFCEKPQNVECRAQFFPNTPLEELGQVVTCSREEGLLCLNKNQLPPICYNYEIRIECCTVVNNCSTASTTTHPPSHGVSTKTKPSWTTTVYSSSTKDTRSHSAVTDTKTLVSGNSHTTTQPLTTNCQPQCNWTKWFDTDFPVPGSHGGDLETYSNILRSGERLCHRPEEITQLQCRAENSPEVDIKDLGQVVQCDPSVGLVCNNRDQGGNSGMCLNYEVRVLCCHVPEGCPTTTHATLVSTSSETVTSSTPGTTSMHTASSTSMSQTMTTVVQTDSTTSVSHMSSPATGKGSTAHKTQSSSTPIGETSTISTSPSSGSPATGKGSTAHKTQTSSTPIGETSTISTTSIPQTSSPSKGRVSTTLRPQSSSTPSGETSTTSTTQTSTASGPTASTVTTSTSQTSSPNTGKGSTAHKTQSSSTPIGETSTISTSPSSGQSAHTTFVGKTSTLSVPGTSTTSVPTSTTASTSSTAQTSSTPIGETSTISTTQTSTASGPTASTVDTRTSSLQTDSTTSTSQTRSPNTGKGSTAHKTQTSSTPIGETSTISTTSIPQTSSPSKGRVSTTLRPQSSSTPSGETSTISITQTSTASGPTASTVSTRDTSITSGHKASPTSKPKPTPTSSTIPTRDTRTSSLQTDSTTSTSQTSSPNTGKGSTAHKTQSSSTPIGETSTISTSPSSGQTAHTTFVGKTSTLSVPGTSTTSVPTSTTGPMLYSEVTYSPVTTHCQPQCNWTKWFDTDLPVPGPHGGDLETYSNILRSGERLCQRPEEITQLQCRAENSPEVDIKDLGQVVQCDPSVGLVCNNRDQGGNSGMCLNYEVRVLCCHVPEGCPTTTHATLVSTSSETVTSSTPGTTSMHTASSTSMPQTMTTLVQTDSTTSVSHMSSPATGKGSTAHKTQTNSTPIGETSTSSVHTASTVSTRGMVHKSTRSVQTASTSSTAQTSSTPIGETSTISTTQTSAASGPTASTVSTRDTSITSGHKASPTSKPKPTPTSSTISTRDTRTSSLQTDSTTSTSQTSSPNTGKGSTAHKTQSSSTPIGETSTISTSPSSGQTAHTTFMGKTSTLFVPGTSTTSVPTSTTGPTLYSEVTYSPVTTHCQPQCNWTKWFDTDFPVPGPHGGDLETYSNILSSGERLCHQPEEITQLQCRAKNYPEIDIKDLGQVVQCDPSVGLVCNNRNQGGHSEMCLNYEVRVLCCHVPEGCPRTDRTPVTLSHKPSFPVVSPTSVSPSSSTSPRVHSTTPCFCSVSGQLYPLGSIIYNQTDLDGYCYYSICSQDCQVVKSVSQACPSTTPSPTPTLSPSTAPPVTERDRCNVFPPRLKGETWPMPNCSQATCEGNNIISLSPRQCPELKEPSCANGYPPLKVDDQDGCCQHYQCQCVCSGWGDPHYITFDGTYYTFLDNCTYVLVQQIVPVFGKFRVLIDNYFCDLGDSVSCPQSIIVEYHQDRVVLTRRPVSGVMTNQIIFNNKVVSPGFQQNGIVVSRVGIKMYVTIQEIGVQVMFSGLIFSVEVPFNLFANNTEGQCGTCTNDKKDECRLPGGSITSSCSEMSLHWKVPNQPSCQGPPPTPTSVIPKPSPTPCPPSPLCWLIISDVFKLCHDVIPPWQFYEGCLFDACHKLDLEVVCSALELYASLCAAQGVCIPWRSHTNNTCPFTCSDNSVYQPCGPSNSHYCYRSDDISPSLILQEAGPKTEGCFCPDNMTLFSTNHSVCVPSCQWCLGPHGEPVEPGHTISIDCQDCICKEATLTCRRKFCPQPTCPEPGFVPVPAALESGQCCPQYSCACNSSHCPPPLYCPKNSSLIVTYEEGACCPSQNCYSQYIFWTGHKGCEVNGTLYQPGDVVSSSLCERCLCEVSSNTLSDVFVVNCETELCNTQCPKGFEYQAMPEQCCGQCVQKTCPFKNSSNSTHYYQPGELWSEPGNPCMTHKCEKIQDVFMVVTMKIECPKINCAPGQAQLREDGCCYDCLGLPQKCTVHQRQQIIHQQNCSSEGPVSISYCQGNCGDSTSMYSLEANTVEHTCECCQELQTSQRNVTLHCDDGSSRTFSYTQVEKCGCLGQRCHGPGDTSYAESSEQEFKSKESEEHGQQSAVRVSDDMRGPF
ncbi:mucin-5AC [Apodemus sylvaticus]|uniref:mucin-5AC n=1 Tax=Apodemus sylvaticus TaxID=10129 RepID=UPI0022421BFE|nr:mucin-5AC [Apodemus sylvaticus]